MKKRKFGKKGIIITLSAAVVVVLIVVACSVSFRAGNTKMNVSLTALQKTTLKNTINVTGTIHSSDPCNVYTTLASPVEKISVSVGDTVKKGDILAVLDTTSLEEDIKQQEYTTKTTDKSANLGMEKAKSDYENALYQYNNDMGTELTSAKASLESAKSALDMEKQAYDNVKAAVTGGKAAQKDLDAEKAKLDQAQSSYDSAQRAVTAARNQSQQNLQTAKNAYDDAVSKSADKSVDVALEKLRKQLQQSVITAPRDGTVTICNAAVGEVPKESLFRIENPSDLIVDAEIKEVDTTQVKAGDPVTITTDATGKEETAGEVLSVAPAATEKTEGTSNVTFAVKVRVTGQNPKLKIGMKAKMNIVLEQKQNVFVVPYDSLVEKSAGNYIIYAAEQEGALYKTKEISVTTGMETDVSVEVSGSGLKEGMKLVTSPDGISAGELIQPASSSSSEGA